MDNTTLDYALMAGEAYFYKRDPANQIPMSKLGFAVRMGSEWGQVLPFAPRQALSALIARPETADVAMGSGLAFCLHGF